MRFPFLKKILSFNTLNTMKNIFSFGEKIKDFEVRVLNEREVRAGAGILFFFAMFSFMNAWLTGDFYNTKIFVIAFLIDFSIRIFINPKYAPSLILGRFFVKNQKPEYTGAVQKRFAWSIGFVLAISMFFLVVINSVIGPINLFICLACLTFLFFESAFGICIGCKIYNLFNTEKAKLCPGGACETPAKEEIQKINFWQIGIVILFLLFVIALPAFGMIPNNTVKNIPRDSHQNTNEIISNGDISPLNDDECKVPEWAIKIGHEEKWKLHHGCK